MEEAMSSRASSVSPLLLALALALEEGREVARKGRDAALPAVEGRVLEGGEAKTAAAAATAAASRVDASAASSLASSFADRKAAKAESVVLPPPVCS